MVPSESVEPVPSALSVNPFVEVVNCATGALFGTTIVIERVTLSVAPSPSVTVNLTS